MFNFMRFTVIDRFFETLDFFSRQSSCRRGAGSGLRTELGLGLGLGVKLAFGAFSRNVRSRNTGTTRGRHQNPPILRVILDHHSWVRRRRLFFGVRFHGHCLWVPFLYVILHNISWVRLRRLFFGVRFHGHCLLVASDIRHRNIAVGKGAPS